MKYAAARDMSKLNALCATLPDSDQYVKRYGIPLNYENNERRALSIISEMLRIFIGLTIIHAEATVASCM